MAASLADIARDQGRGIVGGLVLGLPLLYTMETWWIGWTLPAYALAIYAAVGLLAVSAVVHFVGFNPEHDGPSGARELAQDFAELVLQSILATLVILALFGLVGRGHSLGETVRLALVEIVPVGFGAAVANRMLKEGEEEHEATFGRELAIFTLGALFFAFPVAPTEEVEMMASQAGWDRLALLVPVSVLVAYLALYELQFRGGRGRGRAIAQRHLRIGETCAGYVIALIVSGLLLLAYGHFASATFPEATQQVVVLSFLASLGGATARVII